MSELGEGKTLILVILTIGFFFLIVSTYPSQLLTSAVGNYDIQRPEYFQGLDIGGYAYTHNFTINDATFNRYSYPSRAYFFDLGGHNWYMNYHIARTMLSFGIRHYFMGWLMTSSEPCNFRAEDGTERGSQITVLEMNEDYTGNEGVLKYRVYIPRDPIIGCDVNLVFNISAYSSPGEAFANDGLGVVVGLGLEDAKTTTDAWQLIGAIMWFRAPNIHPIINLFIGFALWFLFIYAFVRLVLRFIPLLG